MHLRPFRLAPLACAALAVCSVQAASGGLAHAADPAARIVIRGAEVGPPVTPFRFDGDVRALPPAPEWKPGDPIREIPRRRWFDPGFVEPEIRPQADPLADLQRALGAQRGTADPQFTNPDRNFAGRNFTGVAPPDTVGDVSPDHFIQSVNQGGGATVLIFDKQAPTPTLITSFQMDNLATGGSCGGGAGDPIVLWDRQAGRWMISEFAGGGAHLCVYVSQSSDPISGGWFAYDFTVPSFPDYPKYGVWPTDANQGDGSYVVTANDGGPGIFALDRGAMLAGAPATFQRLTVPGLPGFAFESPTPADIDGEGVPAQRSPAIIMRHRDTEVHSGPSAPADLLEMWEFDVDWENPNLTTLSQAPSIGVAEFDSSLCGLTSFFCFPQPGTGTTLDPLREVIMNRLQYMQHDDYETLVGNFVVDIDGQNTGGIRWFELRRAPGASWQLHQEGTYTLDADSRWMGASAMDQSGNIALAYNVSSGTTFPSLRYTGRRFDDPPGVMTQPETSIRAGTASSSTNRYGDYAAMGLDPADDCTFWFTGEFNQASSWSTRVASFRFEACGCLVEPSAPSAEAAQVGDNRIDVSWDDSDLPSVVEYEVRRSRTAGGPYETIAVVPDDSPGVAGGLGYVYEDTDVSGGITYYYTVEATDGGACTSDPAVEASATATGACTLRPVFGGVETATASLAETCLVDLAWDPAVPECGSSVTYNVYRSTDPGFAPLPSNRVASGVTGLGVQDAAGLQTNVEYFYIVRAVDASTGIEDLNGTVASATPGGPNSGENVLFTEDFEAEDSFDAWTVTNGPNSHSCGDWERVNSAGQRPTGGSGFYALSLSLDCAPLAPRTSTKVDSPAIDTDIPNLTALRIEFDIYYNHFNGDDATVEVWDGAAWQVVWADSDEDLDTRLSLDVTPYSNPQFRVRFNYQLANDDLWYSVDDVAVIATAVNTCESVAVGPPSVPDGLGATEPLRGDRLTPAGDSLRVTWDASTCTAPDYNLIYGDLSGVAATAVGGGVCALGTSGSFDWSGVPAGDLFFLVVGSDGAGVESSWGAASDGGERNGNVPSGVCAISEKNAFNVCVAP